MTEMKDGEYFRHFEIYMGYACNRACRFCFVEEADRKKFGAGIPFRNICGNLYAAYEKGFRAVSLLGGEPTVYPSLFKIARFAKKTGYRHVMLFSNGLKLADMRYAEELLASGIDGINLNIPSHISREFDYLTGMRGGMRKLTAALENIRALKIPCAAVCVLNSRNYSSLADYAAFYGRLGIRIFVLQYMKFQGRINPSSPENDDNIGELRVSMIWKRVKFRIHT